MPKKQADGRYRAKITIGATADGKPITKYVSGKTTRELEEAKRAAIAHYVDGTSLDRDRVFGEYALEWYKLRKEARLSESSRASYRVCFNKHILPEFGDRMLLAIRYVDIQTWLNGFSGMSNSLIGNLLTIMRGVMGAAFSQGIIPRDPTGALVRPLASQPEEKRAMTKEERKAITDTIRRHEYGAYLATLYYLGLRRGEAAGLQWGDFDWEAGVVHIQRDIDCTGGKKGVIGNLKTKASDRYVTIPLELRELLYPLRSLPHMFLLADAKNVTLSPSAIQRIWILLMIDAGLAEPIKRPEQHGKDGKHKKTWQSDIRCEYKPLITPHFLRHNYVTMLYEAGIDPMVAMRLVGHSDYRTTANIYTHLNKMHLEKASEKLNALFSENKVAEKLPRSEK